MFTILCGILLLGGEVFDAHGQVRELKTLSGRIRWKKAMGVLPKSPGSTEAADNICAQFFVVVMLPGNEKPYQYDIALEDKPEVSKPDYYSCVFEMQVPNKVQLSVIAGMGDGLAWPNSAKSNFHYAHPWVDAGRQVRGGGIRSFTPAKREVMLGEKGMYITFEMSQDQEPSGGTSGQTQTASIVASQTIYPTPYSQEGFVVLTWTAGSDHPNAELWVKYDNSREPVLFVKQPHGNQQVAVQRGRMYTYVVMDGRNVLASTTFVAH